MTGQGPPPDRRFGFSQRSQKGRRLFLDGSKRSQACPSSSLSYPVMLRDQFPDPGPFGATLQHPRGSLYVMPLFFPSRLGIWGSGIYFSVP